MAQTNLLKNIIRYLGVISLLVAYTSCKSEVKDQNIKTKQSVINVNSLRITGSNKIRANKSVNSLIVKKYYAIAACFSDNNLGQKLNNRPVQVSGTPLKNGVNETDASGCIYWEHTLNYDYSGATRCQVRKEVVKIPSSGYEKTIEYSIDTVTDQITNLERGKGCTVLDNVDQMKANGIGGGELILEKINLYWAGLQDMKRSDIRTLTYRTNIQSCLKARATEDRVTRTYINIEIRDRTKLHEPIFIKNVQTDEKGCFDRIFSSPYEQYAYSHWLEKDIIVEVVDGPMRGLSSGALVYINPYETGRMLFGMDSRYMFDTAPMENPIKKNNSININGVMYIQIGNDVEKFSVDNNLNLTTSKAYQIVLNPRVNRGHRFTDGRPRYERMRDGRFRLKFMILAPDRADVEINETNFKDFTYITGADKIVEVRDGVVNSLISIPVKLKDLPRLATRTVSVFKLEPLTDTGLIASTVTGFFKAKIAWIKTNVMQSETLQSSEQHLSYKMNSKQAKEDIQSVSDQIGHNIDTVVSENLADPSKGSNVLNEEEGTVIDETKLRYKKCIEYLFKKAKEGVDNTGTTKCKFASGSSDVQKSQINPFKLKGLPKDIFVNKQLKYQYPNLVYESTKIEETGHTDTVNKSKFNLPVGVIGDLYDKVKALNIKKNDKRYLAIMSLICRDAFPEPKQTGLLSRWLGRSKNPEYSRCLSNPNQFFELKGFMHSHNVDKILPKYSTGFGLSIGARFATSYGTNRSQYLSKRVGADLGFKLPLGEFFGAGIKVFDMSYTWSEGQSHNQNWADDVSNHRNLSIEKFVIDVKGKFEKCVLFTGKNYISTDAYTTMGMVAGLGGSPILLPRQMNKYSDKLDKQYYLCDQPKKLTVSEPWYYIQADVPSAPMLADNYGPTEKKLIKVLRGESTFDQFRKIFEDKTKVYLLESGNDSETPDQKLYENWGHLVEGTLPPSVANKLLIDNYQGAFPGTIQ